MAPRNAVEALLRHYSAASVTHEHRPAEGLGHVGFFREGRATALWETIAAFLRDEA